MINNLYYFDSNLEGESKKTYIKPGIQENVFLKEVKYEKTENGNEFLAFYFNNKFGDVLSHTEWPPRANKPFESMTEQEREDFVKKVNNQKERVKRIVKTYLPTEKFDFKPNSFEEYANAIINLLKGKTEEVPIRVKVVLNDDNFTTLPKYFKYTFIEPMTVSAEDSRIRILNIDKIERTNIEPNIKSENKSTEIEIGVEPSTPASAESKDKTNDLPF